MYIDSLNIAHLHTFFFNIAHIYIYICEISH